MDVIGNICRACESTDVWLDLLLEKNRSLLRKFRACIDIQIDNFDPLPKQLCSECVKRVESFYRFKIKCEYIDQKLRDCILDTENHTNTDVQVESPKRVIKEEYSQEKNECENEEYVIEEYYTTVDQHVDDEINDNANGQMQGDISNDEINGALNDEEIITADDAHEHAFDLEFIIEEHEDPPDSVDMNDVEDPSDGVDIKEFEDPSDGVEIKEYDDQSDNFTYDTNEETFEVETISKITSPITDKSNPQFIFECETCNASFTQLSYFNQHKKSHGNQRFQCDICERWFSKRFHLKAHMTIHAGTGNFECLLCTKSYSNQGNLDRHVRVFHDKRKGYDCDICNKSFSQSTILRQHRSTHLEVRQYECDLCQKCFKTAEYLRMHKHRHLPIELRTKRLPKPNKTSNEKKVCFCKLCGKKSNTKALHLSHMRTHTGEKPYECQFCQQRFSFHQSLKSHLLLHTGEKPYKCDVCSMSFRQIGHLHGHRLTHTGQKNHICSICSKSFALRGNLTVHMRMHTGDTPYSCKSCSRSFYDSNGLKRHMKTHASRDSLVRLETTSVDGANSRQFDSQQEYYVSEATANEVVVNESEFIALYMNEEDCEG